MSVDFTKLKKMRREGECNRCGRCCTPCGSSSLDTALNTCKIYETRPQACRDYPTHPFYVRKYPCSYRFYDTDTGEEVKPIVWMKRDWKDEDEGEFIYWGYAPIE